jgi:hypothetical protein
LVTPIGSADPVEEVEVSFRTVGGSGFVWKRISMADNSLQRTAEIAGRSRPYRTPAAR